MSNIESKTLGAVFLISGTAIGAGMLGLPITTGAGGLFASIMILLFCFFYMLATLFLFLETMYYSPAPSTNLIGLCRRLSGPFAESIAWLLFLSLLYIASAAYMSGSGEVIAGSFSLFYQRKAFATLLFSLFFGGIAIFKMEWIDYLNRLLIYCLMIAFASLIVTSVPHISLSNYQGGTPSLVLSSIPIVVTSFTSHLILPSIRVYLDNDLTHMKKAILIGCSIPLLLYIIWECLILGLLPHSGPFSLSAILHSGQDELTLLIEYLNHHYKIGGFATQVSFFSFFAITTSFWGVMISLRDFIDDGLNLERYENHQIIAVILSFLPPLLLSLFFTSGFSSFLSFAGLIILFLYGFLPIYLVWRARYHLNLTSLYILPGGQKTLILLLIITTAIFIAMGLKFL